MAYTARIAFVVALAVYCVGFLGLAAAVNKDNLHGLVKRGTGVGELDPDVHSTHYNRRLGYGCGNNICYSPSCKVGWHDTHGCSSQYEIGGICDSPLIYGEVHKKVCGDAWMIVCNYTPDFIATFVWNGAYQLTVTNTKKSNLSAGFSSSDGHSCKYGMLLSNDYRGSFKCIDLKNDYRSMMDGIPYDGC